jgi:hypothetical protein
MSEEQERNVLRNTDGIVDVSTCTRFVVNWILIKKNMGRYEGLI